MAVNQHDNTVEDNSFNHDDVETLEQELGEELDENTELNDSQKFEKYTQRYTQRLNVLSQEPRYLGVVTKFSGTYGFGVILGSEQYEGQTVMINQKNILTNSEEVYRTLHRGEYVEFCLQSNDDGRYQALEVTGPNCCRLLCESNPSLKSRKLNTYNKDNKQRKNYDNTDSQYTSKYTNQRHVKNPVYDSKEGTETGKKHSNKTNRRTKT
jgi:cold shock CspA family protein